MLIEGRINIQSGRKEFLETVLPYFSSLLAIELNQDKDFFGESFEKTVFSDSKILEKIIKFLGSLGPESHYITKNLNNEEQLENNEGETLYISLPLNQRHLKMNLNKLIIRSSQLAANSTDEDVRSAACELLHASMIVLIGKCSQGAHASEDFVASLESALPSILRLTNNERQFSDLFRDLLLQISRWLAHNKEEENSLVSSFLMKMLDLAGEGDQSE